jgi:predicted component of type VI protein secretion system
MTWTNRVVWQEGMFLRAQHFQQQDRWLEMLVRARTAALRPHPWGIVEMAIDRDLLSTGRFALSSAVGVLKTARPCDPGRDRSSAAARSARQHAQCGRPISPPQSASPARSRSP